MKLKYLILLAAVLYAAYYFSQNKDLQSNILSQVHQIAPELNKSTLYKWQNSKGEWQITDKPPQKGISFTTITTQDQVNVMPSLSSEKKK